MKISVLLPYKENFSPLYPGAVSLFVYETSNRSLFKKKITVFGSTEIKKKFPLKYVDIKLKRNPLQSQTKSYVDKFINLEKRNKSSIIEIHNRPSYVNILVSKIKNRVITLYFHNDPLSMDGSKTVDDRKKLLKNCYKIIFNSIWSKKRFLEGLENKFVNSNKLLVFYQSALKSHENIIAKKKKWITFVGKLNRAKGYDIFAKSITKILNKYPQWSAKIIGDEKREKILLKHRNAHVLGFKKHSDVLNIFKKTSIAVACSRWDEPFGRTSLEASANGCAVIITNKGGLPETVTNAKIIKTLSEKNLTQKISELIKNNGLRKKLQKLSIKNFYLTHTFVTNQIDNYRKEKLFVKKFNIKMTKKSLRVLHITNFNERLDGRLFFNTGRRINNGLIRLGHSVLGFSDRDIQKYYKSLRDIKGSKTLNEKLRKTCYNYKPDLIILGHADLISSDQIGELKDDYPDTRFGQWFLDPLNKNGPDFERNKERIMDKIKYMDASFITTCPSALKFLPSNKKNYYIPNPADDSFETLNNFNKNCNIDVFFALSHGVHRGVLKTGKTDDRIKFLTHLTNITPNVKFDIYGLNKVQPIWADHYFKTIENAKMGLNLSRGAPIKYYSSDRITQIVGNGLVCLIDEKTQYKNFFSKNEMIFYKNTNDLSEKIIKISNDEKLRKKIAKAGKDKYLKYFNSTKVAEYIIEKTLDIKSNKRFFWEK
jgi:glycosyltransferase involved in cell wall biosynthesis